MKPLNLLVMGLVSGLFGAITLTQCILWDPAVAGLSVARRWELLLPGFRQLSLGSRALGLVETLLYRLYAALGLVPLSKLAVPDTPRAPGPLRYESCLTGSRQMALDLP